MADRTAPTPSFDDFRSAVLLRISADIVRSGFALVPVGFGHCSAPGCDCDQDEDSWAYTVGLVDQGLPEIVVIGMAPMLAQELIDRLLERFDAGNELDYGEAFTLSGVDVKLLNVPAAWMAHDLDRMSLWVGHYAPGRSELTVPSIAQLVFADGEGRFPDEPGCDPLVAACQPVLAADPYTYPALLHRRTKRRSIIRRSAA